ncbi:sensor histidine kinase [Microbacterium sp. STN6]|uniref:sensor histidine kinase n=1 Tax=Microbacterium sp. STN6 TaxID=2995588 RepID=UPI002260A6A3|nr:sensor histidine kinase [Microbacterium sp. STN6]MCX7521241.1 sensor histidine kinase [Microbacterium sp. STN6]
MNHSSLAPVFTTLRVGLHVLMVGLIAFVVVHAPQAGDPVGPRWAAVLAIGCVFALTYAAGGPLRNALTHILAKAAWLTALVLEWAVLLVLTPDAAFLVFPLFFLFLHLVAAPWNVVIVALSTAYTIVALGLHSGWSIGGVIGPVIGAGLAVAIALGYRAMFREAREREKLIADLLATRSRLAETEREAGVLAERARLAREIHDTVAQGLSSIQLLLHAVEKADPAHPAMEHLRLARQTAADDLAETRRFIRELTPRALDEQGIEGALRRLGATTQQVSGVPVTVHVSGDTAPVPMTIETALLRVAQASLANVTQHAQASRADVTLSYMDDSVSLDVIDDGRGFDAAGLGDLARSGASFGIAAMRERVARLGGTASVESSLGAGTAVAVSFPLPPAESEDGR